jgi:penicillin-binding protein 1A
VAFHIRKHGEEIELRDAVTNVHMSLDNISDSLEQAVIATEDRAFYRHPGYSMRGLLRAAWGCLQGLQEQLKKLNPRQICELGGGSTITQQLAKMEFFSNEPSVLRKLKELLMAIKIEAQFDKAQIFAMYLNRVPLGRRIYGVEAAARTFFKKPARSLNLPEAAIIAGAMTEPSRNNFLNNREGSLREARRVLQDMLEAGFITERQQANALAALPNCCQSGWKPWQKIYYADFWHWLRPQLASQLQGREGNFVVISTLNTELQIYAERALNRVIDEAEGRRVGQGALVAMAPNGKVYAMVGGVRHLQRGYNRAVQAKRSPGSLVKPIIYLAALEKGWKPDSLLQDTSITCAEGWQVHNASQVYRGALTLREALLYSTNTAAVRLSQTLGRETLNDTTRRLGLPTFFKDTCMSPLGANVALSLLELTSAYGVFASQGRAVTPYGIKGIREASGDYVYWHSADSRDRVVKVKVAKQLHDLLTGVVSQGTGRHARIAGLAVAGKTGTSSDYNDAWFIGYMPKLVTGVWLGNDTYPAPMDQVNGSGLPAIIFQRFMRNAHEFLPFLRMQGVHESPRNQQAISKNAAMPP